MYHGNKSFGLGVYILHIFTAKWRTLYTFCLRQTNNEQIFPTSLWQRFPAVQKGSCLQKDCSFRITVPITLLEMFAEELQSRIFIFHLQVSKILLIIVDRQLNNYLTDFLCNCGASLYKLNVSLNHMGQYGFILGSVFFLTASVYIFSVHFID